MCRSAKFQRLFVWYHRKHSHIGFARQLFFVGGERVRPDNTPDSLKLADGDTLVVKPELGGDRGDIMNVRA